MSDFSRRFDEAVARYGRVCVGIDPSAGQLARWGLSDDLDGLQTFCDQVVQELLGEVGVVKPQIAFFERFGGEGLRVLAGLQRSLQGGGALVIADAKRGDIGSTMHGYIEGWLGATEHRADALTVHSYLGMEVLAESLRVSETLSDKGVFALCATSNPEGATIQKAMIDDRTVAKYIFDEAERLSANEDVNIGVVIGATLDLSSYGLGDIKLRRSEVPILAPGFGAQGADLSKMTETFGESAEKVIPTMSRELLGESPQGLRDRIARANEAVR